MQLHLTSGPNPLSLNAPTRPCLPRPPLQARKKAGPVSRVADRGLGSPHHQLGRWEPRLSPVLPQWRTRHSGGEKRRGGPERPREHAWLRRQKRPGAPRVLTLSRPAPVGAPRSPRKRPRWRTRLVWVRRHLLHSRNGGHNRRCRPRHQCRDHTRLPPHYRGSRSPPPALGGPPSERRLGQVRQRRGNNRRRDPSSRPAQAKSGRLQPTAECIGTSRGTRASSSGRPSHLMQRNGYSPPVLVILVKHFKSVYSFGTIAYFCEVRYPRCLLCF